MSDKQGSLTIWRGIPIVESLTRYRGGLNFPNGWHWIGTADSTFSEIATPLREALSHGGSPLPDKLPAGVPTYLRQAGIRRWTDIHAVGTILITVGRSGSGIVDLQAIRGRGLKEGLFPVQNGRFQVGPDDDLVEVLEHAVETARSADFE